MIFLAQNTYSQFSIKSDPNNQSASKDIIFLGWAWPSSAQTCSFSSGPLILHTISCLFLFSFWVCPLPQFLQRNGFSPVCILKWFFKPLDSINFFSQKVHECFLTPVCIRASWSLTSPLLQNFNEQNEQLNRFSLVWDTMWFSSLAFEGKPLSQTLHLNLSAFVCVSMWALRISLFL